MFLPFQRNLLSLIPLFHNWLLFAQLYISLLIRLNLNLHRIYLRRAVTLTFLAQ